MAAADELEIGPADLPADLAGPARADVRGRPRRPGVGAVRQPDDGDDLDGGPGEEGLVGAEEARPW